MYFYGLTPLRPPIRGPKLPKRAPMSDPPPPSSSSPCSPKWLVNARKFYFMCIALYFAFFYFKIKNISTDLPH